MLDSATIVTGPDHDRRDSMGTTSRLIDIKDLRGKPVVIFQQFEDLDLYWISRVVFRLWLLKLKFVAAVGELSGVRKKQDEMGM